MVPFFNKMQLVKCHLLKTSADTDVTALYEARSVQEHAQHNSNDPVRRHAWKPCVELEPVLSEVRHRKMIKGAQAGTGGLGFAPAKCKKDTPAGEERASTVKVFENICEEHGISTALARSTFLNG